MNKPTYPIQFSANNKIFRFKSIGENGVIHKIVQFQIIKDNIYNLGFGDFDPITKMVDDEARSNNADLEKVLATILSIITVFFDSYPDAIIYFEGSSPSRIRLYQIVINLFHEELLNSYQIFGTANGIVESFKKNVNYESFYIKKIF